MASTTVSSAAGHCSFPSVNRRPTAPWAMILAVLLCLVSHALAAPPNAAAPAETLVINHEPLHQEGQRWAISPGHEVQRRKVQRRATSDEPEESDSTKSSEPSKTSAVHSVTTTFTIGGGSPKASSTSTTVAASPLPSILDSVPSQFSLGPNGEAAPCPIFINNFLDNPDFKRCYPLSMLFDTSRSFYEAQSSLVGITRTLDATCAANVTFCTSFLTQLAQNLTAPENCGTDYNRGLAAVVDAHRAMLAYAPIYGATCLRDPETGAYCYANAITNNTNPSMTYFYFLPLNKTLPGSTRPACGYCLQQTMDLYHDATADRAQLIANTYATAAEQVNAICGPDFANESLADATAASAAAVGRSVTWLKTAMPLLLGVVVWLF
ncbi:hypothetical protein F5144DRAFT_171308 [Chaetomium tenue]|uniref:Uncharacterized protein n=1 Tax=Chaetomium tenue TaxID=1854479 RepID=A0ACB7PAX8_9PEZI|nr:hypothetical protein F5144DRAFT_171308 [Chaetomium globosum]